MAPPQRHRFQPGRKNTPAEPSQPEAPAAAPIPETSSSEVTATAVENVAAASAEPALLPPRPQVVARHFVAPRLSSFPGMQGFMHPGTPSRDIAENLQLFRGNGQSYFLVILPPDEDMSVERFDDFNALVARIRGFMGTETSVHPFLGFKFGITKGEHKFLTTPVGNVPLFVQPLTPEDIDESGWLGAPPAEGMEAPTQLEMEPPAPPPQVTGEPTVELDETPVLPAITDDVQPAPPPP